MKTKALLLGLVISLFATAAYPCSCMPYTVDFFQNLKKVSPVSMIEIDSVWFANDSNSSLSTPFARVRVIKNYSSSATVGDTLILEGQDGINCNWGYESSWVGDTIIAILGDSAISFYDNFHCGTPAIRLSNGEFEGLDLNEIEAKINQRLTSIAELNGFENIRVNPNPVNREMILNLPENSYFSIDIYSITGKKMRSVSNLKGLTQIDLSTLSTGLYLLQISDGKAEKVLRFVKE